MSSFANLTFVRIFICLEIVLFISSATAENTPEPSAKRYCGRQLTEILALICHGEYGAYLTAGKRAGNERVGGERVGGEHQTEQEMHRLKLKKKYIHNTNAIIYCTSLIYSYSRVLGRIHIQ